MFLHALSVLLLVLPFFNSSATPLLYPRANRTVEIDATQAITCTTDSTNIDPSYPLDYVSQWCGMVSASTPDWLIKVSGLPQGNVDMLYAWEAAGDNFDQTCSTACAAAYQAMILECEYCPPTEVPFATIPHLYQRDHHGDFPTFMLLSGFRS